MDNKPNKDTPRNTNTSSSEDESGTDMQKKAAPRKASGARAKRGAAKTQQATIIDKPSPFDVVFGRGQPFHSHPGNRRMKQLITENKERYKEAKKEDKKEVIDFILDAIRNNGAESGRFLKKVDKGADAPWCEATEKEAYKKVSHSLREKEVFTKPKRSQKRGNKNKGSASATPPGLPPQKAQLKRGDSSASSTSSDGLKDLKLEAIEPLPFEGEATSTPLEFPENFADIGDGTAAFSSSVARAARHSFSSIQSYPDSSGVAEACRAATASSSNLDPLSMDAEQPEWTKNDAMLLDPLLKNSFEPPPFPHNNFYRDDDTDGSNSSHNHQSMFFIPDPAPLREQLLFTTMAEPAPVPDPVQQHFPLIGLDGSTYVSDSDNEKTTAGQVQEEDDDSSSSSAAASATINDDLEAEFLALCAQDGDEDALSFCGEILSDMEQ